jgi:hypothetical protein
MASYTSCLIQKALNYNNTGISSVSLFPSLGLANCLPKIGHITSLLKTLHLEERNPSSLLWPAYKPFTTWPLHTAHLSVDNLVKHATMIPTSQVFAFLFPPWKLLPQIADQMYFLLNDFLLMLLSFYFPQSLLLQEILNDSITISPLKCNSIRVRILPCSQLCS